MVLLSVFTKYKYFPGPLFCVKTENQQSFCIHFSFVDTISLVFFSNNVKNVHTFDNFS